MLSNMRTTAIAVPLLGLALLTTACDNSAVTDPADTLELHRRGGDAHPAGFWRQLAQLARLTAPYHNLENAMAAEYSAQLTPCWYFSGVGAMGYHYGNPAFIDGSVDLLEPEILVYEPKRNGRMRLGAMEYIVPIDAWEGDEPPELLGQTFHRSDELGLYLLHIWLWKYNPDGLFANWNPRVTCRFAEDSEDRAP